MKNLYKRAAALALAATMTAGVLAGCGGGDTTASTGGTVSTPASGDAADPASEPSSEPQEITQLIWYMSINPVAADTEKVIEKLNEYTREKIGVEIDYKVIANPDYKEKMPNLINAGEYFDICFTSNWTTDYLQFVGKDAFMDITELLPQYAEDTYKFIPEAMWNAVKVNGAIYGVPSYKEMGWQGGIVYNSDMAEAYGIDMSKVKTLEDYTDVLKTVSEKSKAEGKDVVGVSGLTVTPKVYVAAGISGQMQHMVGANRSGCVVAVNKDKNAPVFKQCDFGIVGDVKEVLPALTAAL